MSSIMRRRRGLISAIGGSCPEGWASTTTILSDRRPSPIRSPHSRGSGFVQSLPDSVRPDDALIRTRRYDLVIADGKLPDGTGLDVADHAIEIGTKAIIITGYAFSLPVGTHDHYEILLKPLRPIEITTAVAQALRD